MPGPALPTLTTKAGFAIIGPWEFHGEDAER